MAPQISSRPAPLLVSTWRSMAPSSFRIIQAQTGLLSLTLILSLRLADTRFLLDFQWHSLQNQSLVGAEAPAGFHQPRPHDRPPCPPQALLALTGSALPCFASGSCSDPAVARCPPLSRTQSAQASPGFRASTKASYACHCLNRNILSHTDTPLPTTPQSTSIPPAS